MTIRAISHWNRALGFTLIEMMVVVALVGILASIAYPSFIEAIRKGRRADAVSALTQIQHAQERWRANNGTYAGSLGAGGLNLSTTSPDGHYSLAITNNTAQTYTVKATANSSSPQVDDTKCRVFQIRMNDARGLVEFGSENSAGTLNVAASNPCWSK